MKGNLRILSAMVFIIWINFLETIAFLRVEIFQNLIRKMSWNFENLFEKLQLLIYRLSTSEAGNWTHSLMGPSNRQNHALLCSAMNDIKRILVVERFQFIVSTHPEPYNQNYTFSKLQLFPAVQHSKDFFFKECRFQGIFIFIINH